MIIDRLPNRKFNWGGSCGINFEKIGTYMLFHMTNRFMNSGKLKNDCKWFKMAADSRWPPNWQVCID